MLRISLGFFVGLILAGATGAQASTLKWRFQQTCGEERRLYDQLGDMCSRNSGSWIDQRALYRPEPNASRATMTDTSNGSTWSTRMRCQDRADWAKMCRY